MLRPPRGGARQALSPGQPVFSVYQPAEIRSGSAMDFSWKGGRISIKDPFSAGLKECVV